MRGHKNARNDLTAEFVRSVLNYEPETGVFRWKVHRPPRSRAGDIAGSHGVKGRRYIWLNGRYYYGYRLAWLIMMDEWPDTIDHINGDMTDDRFANLRPASYSENACNRPVMANNRSGYKGVSLCSMTGRWVAELAFNGKRYRLGRFDTPELAYQAYCQKAKEVHGEFFHD